MKLFQDMEKWGRSSSLLVGGALIVTIGAVDYLTGYELSLSVFYLIPVSFLSWTIGRWGGLAGALASSIVWTSVDLAAGQMYSIRFYFFWHIITRTGIMSTIALLFSSLRKAIDHERALARIDHLTGAANARSFLETLHGEVDRSSRYKRAFTLAYMDLDNFKRVNDSFGHTTGDLLLKSVVSTMKKLVRSTDVVARLGGDEFALLLPETDQKAAMAAITKMRDGLLLELARSGWPVTVSIGALTSSDTRLGVEELLKQVDNLMYAAKMKGKNTVSYSPALKD